MYWLVFQSFIEKEEFDSVSMSKNIIMFTGIRRVEASSKEQAIGKFILDTADTAFIKRVEPVTCFEFDKLKTI